MIAVIKRCRVVLLSPGLVVLLMLGSLAAHPMVRADNIQWTPAGTLSAARSGHTATLLDDGRVLVTGGFDDSTTFASVEIYDPASNTWSFSDPLKVARAAHTATLLMDGTVLVAGGVGTEATLTSVELFDPLTGAWTPVEPLAGARLGHSANLLPDGTVVIAGGVDVTGTVISSVERYDPGTGQWASAADMRVARRYHTATIVRPGTLIVAGGQSRVDITDSVERYDFGSDRWTDLPSLETPRVDHAAAALPDGSLLVVGGISDSEAGTIESSVERLAPDADAWSPAAPAPFASARHSSTTLVDGSVLVAGGFTTSSGTISDAQRYLPATNTWEPTGSLVGARQSHVATVLMDGDVLVTGGWNGAHQESVERYPQNDPPVARPPVASLRLGTLPTETIPVSVSWPSAQDADGIHHYRLQRRENNAAWTVVPLAEPLSQSVLLQMMPGREYRFRVRATDILNALGQFATSSAGTLNLRQEWSSGIRYSGGWPTVTSSGLSGGSARFATAAGSSASISFDGTSVAWVTGKGPQRGRARVYLDGISIATIDLYAPTNRSRQIVFARNGLTSGSHTLRIVALGNGASSGTRVDLDAIIVLK